MTKQEEIREHLIGLFEQTDFSKETPEQLADAVLWVENENGVVIKVERELPTRPWDYFGDKMEVKEYEQTQEQMLMAGYSAWEPLEVINEGG